MSKLDKLCDFSEQKKKVERYRKFEREVRPSCTFAVDDNWRMVPVRKLHPKKFAIAGTSATSTDSSDREDKPAGVSIPTHASTRARTDANREIERGRTWQH